MNANHMLERMEAIADVTNDVLLEWPISLIKDGHLMEAATALSEAIECGLDDHGYASYGEVEHHISRTLYDSYVPELCDIAYELTKA